MSDYSKFDPAALDSLQSNLRNAYSAVDEITNTLESKIEQNIEAWEGGARDAYFQRKTEWEKLIGELNQVLMQLSDAIGQINEQYQATEAANMKSFE